MICPVRALADDVVITGAVNSKNMPLAGATIVDWTAELSVIKPVPEANANEPPRQRPLQGVER